MLENQNYVAQIDFHTEVPLEPPKDWIDEHFIGIIQPEFVVFLGALAAVAVFRKLTGI